MILFSSMLLVTILIYIYIYINFQYLGDLIFNHPHTSFRFPKKSSPLGTEVQIELSMQCGWIILAWTCAMCLTHCNHANELLSHAHEPNPIHPCSQGVDSSSYLHECKNGYNLRHWCTQYRYRRDNVFIWCVHSEVLLRIFK